MSSKRIIDLRKGSSAPAARSRSLAPVHARKEKRASPLRARRRRHKIMFGGVVLLLLSGMVYGVHWLSYLPQINIQTIQVRGEEHMPEGVLHSYVESQLSDGTYRFLSRTNMFLYPRAALEKGIESSFPRIRSARVFREDPLSTVLIVEAQERQPFAQWCMTLANCFQMDDTGYVFAEAASSSHAAYSSPYTFTGDILDSPIGKTYIPGHLPGVLALLRMLQQRGDFIPTGVSIDGEQDFSVQFEDGFMLKASFGQDADTLARDLQLVLSSDALVGKESELEYVDLRFGNRVYYKMNGEEQVEQ
jgi:cell division septal protein FtsQ